MSERPRPQRSEIAVTATPPVDATSSPPPSPASQGASLGASEVGNIDNIQPGRKIGKYVIRRVLGRGGMGAVYEATDAALQRNVALKILPHEFSANEQALQRFIREARMAARLNHPNTVAVYEIGRKGTIYFIAMELVTGVSGQELLSAGKAMAWREATRAAIDACKGLASAHAAGMIHRDIKPGNLLWTEAGSVKLSDFGLAKPHETENLQITQRNQFVGTPLFMSPEQCRNDAVDARSDIYSLGATYFMLLTGRAPYDQGSAIQILFAHCSAPIPDASEINSDIPPMCAHVVRKAMAKSPADRYQSVEEMQSDLETALGTDASTQQAMLSEMNLAGLSAGLSGVNEPIAPPAIDSFQRSGKFPWLVVGGACAAVLIIAILIVLLTTRSSSNESTETTVASKTTPIGPTQVPVATVVPNGQQGLGGPNESFDNGPHRERPAFGEMQRERFAQRRTIEERLADAGPNGFLGNPPPGNSPSNEAAPNNTTPNNAGPSNVAPNNAPPGGVSAENTPPGQPSSENKSPAPPESMKSTDGTTGESSPGNPQAAAPGQAPAEGPNQTRRQPPGEPPDRQQNGSNERDPWVRELVKTRQYAMEALKNNDAGEKTIAARTLILWYDFLNDLPGPIHKKLAVEVKASAEKLSPGISDVQPRVKPEPGGPPLPPPPGEQGPSDANAQRPGGPGQGGPGQGGPGSQGGRRPPPGQRR